MANRLTWGGVRGRSEPPLAGLVIWALGPAGEPGWAVSLQGLEFLSPRTGHRCFFFFFFFLFHCCF